jgi:dTDP-4-dehydrorhamnose 3,5-epimerase
MKVERLAIPDVLLLEPARFGDARGFFSEVWSRRTLAQHGLDVEFVQDNHSLSREGSPTYGHHVSAVLSAENWRQLWVPRGFAHGFVTLEPDTEVLYKVDAGYDRAADAGILWNDPALGIAWPVAEPILSDKDRDAPRLAEIPPPFPAGSW